MPLGDSSDSVNFTQKFEQIREMERLESKELIVQVILVGTCCLLGWFFLGLWQLLPWFITCYGLIVLEKLLLNRNSQKSYKDRYYFHLGLSFCIASAAATLPIFLWLHGGEVFYFAVLAYLVGATLNTFLIRSRSWQVMLCYLIPNSSVFVVISVSFLGAGRSMEETVLAIVIAVAIVIYFATSIVEATRQYRELLSTQQKLLHSQKLETLGTLSGGIAHDFNNLLGVISGNLELLKDGSTVRDQSEMLSQAITATERAATFTQRLLAFGRRSHLVNKAVDINSLFSELKEFSLRLLPENIDIEFEAQANVRSVLADESALHASIMNLTVNARDAQKNGGLIIVSAQNYQSSVGFKGYTPIENPNRPYVQISVKDFGSGIAPAMLPEVFEPYVTSKRAREGSGLGLAMVLGFARQSSGGVRITSELEQGTTVDLLLPAASPSSAIRVDVPKEATVACSATAHVLVVEDEPELLQLYVNKLKSEGFTVSAAVSGDEAWEKLMNGCHPDLIVTDVVMPGELQGFALVRKSLEVLEDTKFIILSGYAPPEEQTTQVLEAEIQFMTKPVSLNHLSDEIKRLLKISCVRQQVSRG